MQSCRAYGQLDDKKEVVYDEIPVPPAELKDDAYTTIPNVQTEDRYKPPKWQHTQRKSQIADNQKISDPNEYVEPNQCTPAENPHVNMPTDIASSNTEKKPKRQYTQRKSQIPHNRKESNPNEYEEPNKCTPAENPLYVNLPTDIATSNRDSEDAYEELVSFIKSNFSSNQMDAMVTMLQSVKQAEEGSQAEDSGTVPLSVPPPPAADPMVDIDIYPGVIDYNSDEEDEKEPEIYTDASTPPFSKDKPTSCCSDFKSKEGILAFGMLLYNDLCSIELEKGGSICDFYT